MNAEALAAIHRMYDAMNRRDVAALRQLGREHPDYSWEPGEGELDSPGSDPNEAMTRAQDIFAAFEEMHTEILETIDLGPEQVIFVVHHRGRGSASGVPVDRHEAHLWTARDGHIVSLREYATVAEAREAAA